MSLPEKIYTILFASYGPQGWWPVGGVYDGRVPNTEEQFEICIGAILTQNTAWTNVEKALGNLRDNLSKARLVKMEHETLAQLIRPAGYFNQKAKKIKAFISFLDSRQPITRATLLSVWGIGPETADSMLLYAYGQPYFVIDAYTKRIFSRIGFRLGSYSDWQEFFHKSLPQDVALYKEYHALLVEHAKSYCRTKPLCGSCPLTKICPKRL